MQSAETLRVYALVLAQCRYCTNAIRRAEGAVASLNALLPSRAAAAAAWRRGCHSTLATPRPSSRSCSDLHPTLAPRLSALTLSRLVSLKPPTRPVEQRMWGVFGPIQVKTKRGTRITFIAGFVTLPLTAFSVWRLLKGPSEPVEQPREQLPTRDLDLTNVK